MIHYVPEAYSRNEEIANASIHGLGIVLGLVGLVLISIKGVELENYVYLVSGVVFCVSLLLLYTSSTLYHIYKDHKKKRIMKVADHASIYILIAGSYTPFTLVGMKGTWGWTIFGIIWVIATFGVIFKFYFAGQFRFVSTLIYIMMSWLLILAGNEFFTAVSGNTFYWLLTGGIFYTSGTIFYLAKKLPYHHAIWHCFVLFGSFSHFIAIYVYLIPR